MMGHSLREKMKKNFAICWNNLRAFRPKLEKSKRLVNQQETLTKDPQRLYASNFLYWLIGFIEGDGCLTSDKNNRLYLFIVQKDPKVLYKIKDFFKFGSVTKHNKIYYRYAVSKKEDIITIYNLLNGQLILKKSIRKFELWSKILNLPIVSNTNQSIHPYWLTGFIDAEGCFNTYWVKDKRYKLNGRFRYRFVIGQTDELEILTYIKKVIGNNKGSIQIKNNHYIYSLWGNKDQLLYHLDKYKLLTNKRDDYISWKRKLKIKSTML